jgi:hypothetical protein
MMALALDKFDNQARRTARIINLPYLAIVTQIRNVLGLTPNAPAVTETRVLIPRTADARRTIEPRLSY